MENNTSYDIYKDMSTRTKGEIYIGVVGPVRTGKSTFIKNFMELMILPEIEDENEKKRIIDELPQSSDGKTIMTTKPSFVPNNAIEISSKQGFVNTKLRLIDCVGYVVKGCVGAIENDKERMVKTPWFEYEIPFSKAAQIGTDKVIKEHSNLGIIITTDGSFTDLAVEDYDIALEHTIKELLAIHKPFVVVVNSKNPDSDKCKEVVSQINNKYNIICVPMDLKNLNISDIKLLFEALLKEFPVTKIKVDFPKWLEMIPITHPIKAELINTVKYIMNECNCINDLSKINNLLMKNEDLQLSYIDNIKVNSIDMSNGHTDITFSVDEKFYYQVISEIAHKEIPDQYGLVSIIKEYSTMQNEYNKVIDAINIVRNKGYAIVSPIRDEITLEEPEIIRSGNKFGVKIKANAPSIHFIKTEISTEISPIVGDENQAKDLIKFINDSSKDDKEGIWNTNIFGKTIEQIVKEGINSKIENMSEKNQIKMQDTLQKVSNDSKKRVICIII